MKIIADTNIPFVEKCFSSIGSVELVGGADIKAETVADADILLVRSVTKVDRQLLEKSKVKFVATATIGIDHIDTQYLREADIGFASAPGSNANSVAEYIVAALLEIAAEKDIDLQNSSIGIIGVGNVGSRVEQKTRALGMRVVLNDPPLQRETGDAKYRDIEELYDCDFITMHTPLTYEGVDKTYHLADRKFFDSLKNGVVFMNSSRGSVVETDAIKGAIKEGKIKAAALDVWENEPQIDAELLEMVDIATPHIAGYSYDGKVCGMVMIYRAACEFFSMEPEFDAGAFLPEPQLPMIEVSDKGLSETEMLRQTVQKIYDIKDDDSDLRKGLYAESMGKWFRGLRKNYHIRREFQNTKLEFADVKSGLKDKFAGIGFEV